MAGPLFFAQAQELLQRRDAGASWAALTRLIGWQEGSVRTIVSRARCGKLREPGTLPAGHWTPAMDEVLDAHWATENSHQIAQRLTTPQRVTTHWAVNARARRRGLVKPGAPASWWSKKMEGANP